MKKTSRIFGIVMIVIILASMSFMCFADNEEGVAGPIEVLGETDSIEEAEGDLETTEPLGSFEGLDIATAPGSQSFSIINTYPKMDAKNVSLENVGVKIYLSEDLNGEKLGAANDNCFKLVGPYTVNKERVEEYTFPLRVLYSESEPNMLIVIVDKDSSGKTISLLSNEKYTLTIEGSFRNNAGDTIGSDYTLNFTSVNQKRNSTISTILMFVLFGGIMFFSMRAGKKQVEEVVKKQEAFNPYKEAKKTGKPVEEIIEAQKKLEEKAAQKEAKKLAKEKVEKEEVEVEDYIEEGHYRVAGPKPISSGGSSYVTGRKALAEKKALEEAERKAKEAEWAKNKKSKKK